MFRFKFIASYAAWVIQIQCLGFLWMTVKSSGEKPADLKFQDLAEAKRFADDKGLPQHYAEQQSPLAYHRHMETPNALTYKAAFKA